ncbi:S26 family signal peptidase [Plantactinospora sp. GCM10030261]|uniref:S26 family signal peptidase n=1 Tax=Plantactinospora sp. GCM10030261 TaxID=3273420 RepID=UPI00361472EC
MTWFLVTLCAIASVVGLGVTSRRRVLVVTVVGVSMTPTLHPDDRVLARRRPASRVRAGDVVVLREPVPCRAGGSPGPPAPLIVKRLAAVPGDPFPRWLPAWARDGATVPADRYVVVGDNPNFSVDSRRFGLVAGDRLIGVVVRRVGGDPVAPAPATVIGPVVYRRMSLPTHPTSGGG